MNKNRATRVTGRIAALLVGLLIVAACGEPTVPPTGEAPVITSFSADPTTITEGASSTLAWTVTGDDVTITIDDGDTDVLTTGDLTGSTDVTPTTTTTYTLTATNDVGSDTATVTVTVTLEDDGIAVLSDVSAELVLGSRIALTWTAENAIGFDVYAVENEDDADVLLLETLPSGATGATVGIPASTRQTLRVVALGAVEDDATDLPVPANVVVSAEDYDPYDSLGFSPEDPIPGTLRYVVANAPSGSIVGFAADVTLIELYGVDLVEIGGVSQDAHLIFRDDVTVSGPEAKVTLLGVSGAGPDAVDPFTWQSRVVFVPADTTVVLDNLVISGGTFIFNGAGIRNDGTLTLSNSEVSGNRAWNRGGGIWNTATGTLTIEGSLITNNRSVSEDDEVDVTFPIRDDPTETLTVSNSGFGGGIYNNPGGVVTITDSIIAENEAKISGGGIYNNDGDVSLTGSTVTDNAADHRAYPAFPEAGYYSLGGGAYNSGSFVFTGGDFEANVAADLGGGYFHDASSTGVISDTTFAVNDADYGGAIRHEFFTGHQDNLTLAALVFTGNTARTADPDISLGDRGVGPAAFVTPAPLPGRYDPSVEDAPGYRDR